VLQILYICGTISQNKDIFKSAQRGRQGILYN
jgi:hypothetical protein